MDGDAREALATIRDCVRRDRVRIRPHFTERMHERGLYWADVVMVIDDPSGIRENGFDDAGRAKWIVAGATHDGLRVEIVAALDRDARGKLTVFLTMFYV